MWSFIKAGCMLLFFAMCLPAQRMASTYKDLQAFVDSCPQNDPYTPIIRRDFQVLKDQLAVGDIACTEPYTQMPPAEITDELWVIQTLRFMYYMDMGRSSYLPWTALRLYDWLKSRVSGINIVSSLVGGECCLVLNHLKYINVGSIAAAAARNNTTYSWQARGMQTPVAQATNAIFFAHEARHTEGDGYFHVGGCPGFPVDVPGCDQTYDETNLSPFGIQYYLAKQMLTGGINLGYSCDPTAQKVLGDELRNLANIFTSRFITNPPPALTTPASPGGPCIPASTFTLNSVPTQVGSGASFILGISASNAQAGWTADSAVAWIAPTAGINSVGSGQATFTVSPNVGGAAQSGTVVAAGQTVLVNCASDCTVSAPTAIRFGALSNAAIGTGPFTITATASSWLPVTFTSTTTEVCTVTGSTVTIVGEGTCSITATQAGNSIYSAATPVTQNFTVTGTTSQTIVSGALRNVTFGVAPFTISAMASSALAVTFVSTTPSVCTVSGSTVTIVSVGTCSITASQSGNAIYAAATPVTQSFAVMSASQLMWKLSATFDDGGKAEGYFITDSEAKTFSNWDVSTTSGNVDVFPPFEFTPANSLLGFERNDPSGLTIYIASFDSFRDAFAGNPEQRILSVALASSLSGGGGIDISPGLWSNECFDCFPSRAIVSGNVTPAQGAQSPSIASGGIAPLSGTSATIQPGEMVSIQGTNLASSTATSNGGFPTSLGGTTVGINGKAAYLWFVSPTQIDLQAPDDAATGSVPVIVTTTNGTAASTVTLAPFAPSFFLHDGKHVIGLILRPDRSGGYGGGAYDFIGPKGALLSYRTVAAKAGDSIELFATGLGPTNPAVQAGRPFSGAAPATNPVSLLINNVSVTPAFAGLVSAGVYQINLKVPPGLGTGDVSLVAIVGGAQTQPGVVISLQ